MRAPPYARPLAPALCEGKCCRPRGPHNLIGGTAVEEVECATGYMLCNVQHILYTTQHASAQFSTLHHTYLTARSHFINTYKRTRTTVQHTFCILSSIFLRCHVLTKVCRKGHGRQKDSRATQKPQETRNFSTVELSDVFIKARYTIHY